MKIDKDRVVLLHYTLTESNVDGALIQQTKTDQPLGFIYGIGSMIPDFESSINGLGQGDNFSFGIEAKKAYGEKNPEALIDVPKAAFMKDGVVQDDLLEEGKILPMQDQNGNPLEGMIMNISEENVKMDFNHPLAGVDLWFKGEIVEVRNATEEELNHKHVHGEGGVDH